MRKKIRELEKFINKMLEKMNFKEFEKKLNYLDAEMQKQLVNMNYQNLLKSKKTQKNL